MRSQYRRDYQMGLDVAQFDDDHPDTDPAQQELERQVKALLRQIEEGLGGQRAGLIDVASAAEEKRKLIREMQAGPIAHLAAVGRRAAREDHELGSTFKRKPGRSSSHLEIRTAGRSMQQVAEGKKELMVKHGLSLPVLENYGRLLDRFDAAVALGTAGRAAHKSATQELRILTAELRSVVQVMDGRNRLRFADDPALLDAWIGARTVRRRPSATSDSGNATGPESPSSTQEGTPGSTQGSTPAAGGEVRPAA
jgi:hypothetical protein